MEIVSQAKDSAQVILTQDELLILNQAMNEVANGIHISDREFSTRLGYTRAEVQTLLGSVSRLLDAMVANSAG